MRGPKTYSLCVAPQSGGTSTTVWSGTGLFGIGYCTWSPDDSRLAVWRMDAGYGSGVDQYGDSFMFGFGLTPAEEAEFVKTQGRQGQMKVRERVKAAGPWSESGRGQ